MWIKEAKRSVNLSHCFSSLAKGLRGNQEQFQVIYIAIQMMPSVDATVVTVASTVRIEVARTEVAQDRLLVRNASMQKCFEWKCKQSFPFIIVILFLSCG